MDFLLRQLREFIGVEVRAVSRLAARDFAGLRAIASLTGLKRRILVHLGPRPFNTPDGIEVLPAVQFAEELAAGRI